MDDRKVGVIGAGAMGSAIAARLAANGAHVLTPLQGRSQASIDRARSAGMVPACIDDVAQCGLVLSIVPPSQAIATAREVAGSARRRGFKGRYVDLNAVAPQTVQDIAALFEGTALRFLDGCIIGGPPQEGASGPHVYISGAGEDTADRLIALGLDARRLDGAIGAASALKMCYAGINKGLTGLGTAMLLAAVEHGADEALVSELNESAADIRRKLGRNIPDMYPKAYRWVAEMHEIAAFLGPDNPAAQIFRGMAGLYEQMERDHSDNGRLAGQLSKSLGE